MCTKIKNVISGSVLERTFNPTEKYPKAMVERKEMQYLYSDDDLYYFMDLETYDQLPLGHALVEDAMQYVKENTNVNVKFFKGEAFSVEAPNFVELEITETDPGFKRATRRLRATSRRFSRQAQKSWFRCSSTRETKSVWTPEPATTWSGHKLFTQLKSSA